MPILYRANSIIEEDYPGVPRAVFVDARHGAEWGHILRPEPRDIGVGSVRLGNRRRIFET